jgi:hypothetical protein
MPKGPKGEKRPADVIGNAVKVMKIATGVASSTTSNGRVAILQSAHKSPEFRKEGGHFDQLTDEIDPICTR